MQEWGEGKKRARGWMEAEEEEEKGAVMDTLSSGMRLLSIRLTQHITAGHSRTQQGGRSTAIIFSLVLVYRRGGGGGWNFRRGDHVV